MTEDEIRADERERCARLVPTNWLDELLTGKDGIGQPPYSGPDIERLLSAVAARIRQTPAGVLVGDKQSVQQPGPDAATDAAGGGVGNE